MNEEKLKKLEDFKTHEENMFKKVECIPMGKLIFPKDIMTIEHVRDNIFKFLVDDKEYKFKMQDHFVVSEIIGNMRQNKINLSQVLNSSKTNNVYFLDIFFFCNFRYLKEVNVKLSDSAKRTLMLYRLISQNKDKEILVKEIQENFIFKKGNNTYFAYSKEVNEKDGSIGFKKIRLYGKNYNLEVELKGSEGKEYLIASRVQLKEYIKEYPEMILAKADLTFESEAEYIHTKLLEELHQHSKYIRIWDDYNKKEGDFLLNKARKVGVFSIESKNNIGVDGITIIPQKLKDHDFNLKLLKIGDSLRFSSEIPKYILDKTLDYSSYFLRNEVKNEESAEIKNIDYRNGLITIDTQATPDEKIVSFSLIGDKVQINRKAAARKSILEGKSANPMLGLIIEGELSEYLIQKTATEKLSALSNFVKEKIFNNNPPTPIQKEAIEIALNTPDMAVIQGPPGTGKTTVITAIIERLNEEFKKKKSKGEILVSSYQHDAVHNVIERLNVNSIPTVKFGKSLRSETAPQDEILRDWCLELADKIREKNPTFKVLEQEKKLDKLNEIYVLNPSNTNALNLLKHLKDMTYNRNILDEIDLETEKIEQDNKFSNSQDESLIKMIYRVRTDRESFLDDGNINADMLYIALERYIDKRLDENKRIMDVLEKASEIEDPDEKILNELKEIKKILLKKCVKKPRYIKNEPSDTIYEIYEMVKDEIKKPNDKENEVLYNLLENLENNLSRMKETIASYNVAYASTTSQSLGTEIRKAKDLDWGEIPEYDTVIIDEAARANPGDLMVPLSQAKRRIILVGDHRQLPHMYNEEIFKSIEDVDDETISEELMKEMIQNSMFEYLKAKCSELTLKDGIKRAITLDAQYRSHPVIGNFINENFYKKYDEGFSSPRKAEEFKQGLYEKPVVWVDMPKLDGREKRVGTTWMRESEADYIVEKLKEYLNEDSGKELSYGIISFYKKQVDLIKEKLGDLSEIVKVGSVDAFQGMEFDVIFLSIVRDGGEELKIEKNAAEKDLFSMATRNYGFLISENRICVGLSRAKKLLVIVGNSEIFNKGDYGILANKMLPSMKNLYELCKRDGIIVDKEGKILNESE